MTTITISIKIQYYRMQICIYLSNIYPTQCNTSIYIWDASLDSIYKYKVKHSISIEPKSYLTRVIRGRYLNISKNKKFQHFKVKH